MVIILFSVLFFLQSIWNDFFYFGFSILVSFFYFCFFDEHARVAATLTEIFDFDHRSSSYYTALNNDTNNTRFYPLVKRR